MKFSITNTQIFGIDNTIRASGHPFRTEMSQEMEQHTDQDIRRIEKLGHAPAGSGHDTCLKGVTVHMDIMAPLYWWKQAQRYHWMDFISSQSTMHCLLRFNLKEQCVIEVRPEIIEIIEGMIEDYKSDPNPDSWKEIVASTPSGFCLGATMTTNYLQLKTIYLQRKNHKLSEWHDFCAWCETLPRFIEFTQK